jgi:hypothetical protein
MVAVKRCTGEIPFFSPVNTESRPVPDSPFWEAAPKMGNAWFGMRIRLAVFKSFPTPHPHDPKRVLPYAIVHQLAVVIDIL